MTDISWLWSIDWSCIRTSLTSLAILFAKRPDAFGRGENRRVP
jgi:hypothetical protein